jgi:hypothetical protein
MVPNQIKKDGVVFDFQANLMPQNIMVGFVKGHADVSNFYLPGRRIGPLTPPVAIVSGSVPVTVPAESPVKFVG